MVRNGIFKEITLKLRPKCRDRVNHTELMGDGDFWVTVPLVCQLQGGKELHMFEKEGGSVCGWGPPRQGTGVCGQVAWGATTRVIELLF